MSPRRRCERNDCEQVSSRVSVHGSKLPWSGTLLSLPVEAKEYGPRTMGSFLKVMMIDIFPEMDLLNSTRSSESWVVSST